MDGFAFSKNTSMMAQNVHSSIHLWMRIPIDSNSIFVSWGEQLFTGGNPVEKYAIEWSSDEVFNTNRHSEEPKVFGRIEQSISGCTCYNVYI